MGTIALSRIPEENVKSVIEDTRYMNTTLRLLLHKDSMDIALTIKSLDIEQVHVNTKLTGHLIS